MNLTYVVKNEKNLREVVKEKLEVSSSLLVDLKREKNIYLNGSNRIYMDMPVQANDKVVVDLDFDEDNSNIVPTKMDLDILYEDKSLIAINKPPFMPVHPSFNHYTDTLSNGLKFYFDTINLKRKIRPINRLDKDTSGIILFAKNAYCHDKIQILKKEYLTIVCGKLEGSGEINKPIGRKLPSIIERCIDANGETAITKYEVLKQFNNYTLLKCTLVTGRTHQIRVHMQWVEHPILGDTLYGTKSDLINRQALHSYKLEFLHPITKQKIELVAPTPSDFLVLL